MSHSDFSVIMEKNKKFTERKYGEKNQKIANKTLCDKC